MELTIVAVASGVVAATGVFALLGISGAGQFLDKTDKPNAMHDIPVPRIGGIAIVAAVLVVAVPGIDIGAQGAALPVTAALAVVLACLSLLDDRNSLSARLRFGVHLVAAVLLIAVFSAGFQPDTSRQSLALTILALPVGACFLVVVVLWMTNLYNFMDGANGLAGFMGAIGFGSLAIASHGAPPAADAAVPAIICAALSGACAGFLFFNFPRARVFMGDAGSIPLGFLAAALGLYGNLQGIWPWWFPVLVFSPFIVDASVTLAKRLVRRERVWEAHRQHYYHRLILVSGWTHVKTACAYVVLMLLAGGHGLLALSAIHDSLASTPGKIIPVYATPPFIIGFWVLTYTSLLACLERRFSLQNKK